MTSVKSCSQSAHKGLETVGPEWAQVGDKRKTSVKSCGQSAHTSEWRQWETSDRLDRQVKNHAARAPTRDWRQQPQCGRNASLETYVKSCGPVVHPFQGSKNPSQVKMFGESE